MTNFGGTPLIALSKGAIDKLSTLLNPPKVLQTCDKRFRDWRGLAAHFGLTGEVMPSISSSTNPTGKIFEFLKNKKHRIGLDDLVRALQKIDRWDIFDDIEETLERDTLEYHDRLQKGNAQAVDAQLEEQILTIDDIYRNNEGLSPQFYDGFLLYADENKNFADEIVDYLEQENELRLCIKDRDLIANVTFEHDVLMQLIDERCNRLIVILSPDFLKSPINTFLLSYAQARGITKARRAIVPILYESCEIPRQLHATCLLDYRRTGVNFWPRLVWSVSPVTPGQSGPGRIIRSQPKKSTKRPTPPAKVQQIIDLERHVVPSEVIVSESEIRYDVPSLPDLESLRKDSGKKSVFKRGIFSLKSKNQTRQKTITTAEASNETLSIVLDHLPSVPTNEPGESGEIEVDKHEKKKEKKKGVKKYFTKKVKELVST